jgi:hypothetical protein
MTPWIMSISWNSGADLQLFRTAVSLYRVECTPRGVKTQTEYVSALSRRSVIGSTDLLLIFEYLEFQDDSLAQLSSLFLSKARNEQYK